MASRATAFGIDVESDVPLSLLAGSVAKATGRLLEVITSGTAASNALEWPKTSRLIADERHHDGKQIYQIEGHPDAGYLISGPEHGAYRLSADGRHLWCDTHGFPDAKWQRLLIAQVLPFAALLQGLEVFHASAVVWNKEAVIFLGPSHVGKTSLAVQFCSRGRGFLADDVVALECREQQLFAHPGTPVAGIVQTLMEDRYEAIDTRCNYLPRIDTQERLTHLSGAHDAVPATVLFFLDRRAEGPKYPQFQAAADAKLLLSATFNFVLATPERLRSLLDVCALAAHLRVERVIFGPAVSVPELSAAIEERLGATR